MSQKSDFVILSSGGENVAKINECLSGIGFLGTKNHVASLEELEKKVEETKGEVNIVMHIPAAFKNFADFDRWLTGFFDAEKMKALIFYAPDQSLEASSKEHKNMKFVEDTQIVGSFFIELFSAKPIAPPKKKSKAIKIALDRDGEQERQKLQSLKKNTALTAAETSKHLLPVFDLLKVYNDSNFKAEKLHEIAQLFNGLFGTFAFYGDLPGWRELKSMAFLVDSIARGYSEGDTVEQNHSDYVYSLAKCSFEMLQSLRENSGVKKNQIDTSNDLINKIEGDGSVSKIERLDQSDIDKMLG